MDVRICSRLDAMLNFSSVYDKDTSLNVFIFIFIYLSTEEFHHNDVWMRTSMSS